MNKLNSGKDTKNVVFHYLCETKTKINQWTEQLRY